MSPPPHQQIQEDEAISYRFDRRRIHEQETNIETQDQRLIAGLYSTVQEHIDVESDNAFSMYKYKKGIRRVRDRHRDRNRDRHRKKNNKKNKKK